MLRDERTISKYNHWVWKLTGLDTKEYSLMLSLLSMKQYRFFGWHDFNEYFGQICSDIHNAHEAIATVRKEYIDELERHDERYDTDRVEEWYDASELLVQPCNVIEAWLGIIIRLNRQYLFNYDDWKDVAPYIIPIFVENLGLETYTNNNKGHDMRNFPIEINMAVDNWMDHKYKRDGKGSIMYIPGYSKDDRDLRYVDSMDQGKRWVHYVFPDMDHFSDSMGEGYQWTGLKHNTKKGLSLRIKPFIEWHEEMGRPWYVQ